VGADQYLCNAAQEGKLKLGSLSPPPLSQTRFNLILLAGFCWFLFFFGLAYFGLIGADEPRYAQVAREMLQRQDWVTPTLGGQAWLEKPVLYYWEAMIAYKIFGVSDWVARLPSAFDATLMVIAVYLFLRRFRSGSELDGSLITAGTAGVVGFARAASMDMPLVAMLTIAMLAWYANRETNRRIYLAIFYVFMALGTLAKGPVATLLAVLIILSFAIIRREYRIIKQTLWIPGILLFCLVALPWYLLVQIRNPEFLRVFILQHNLARFGSNLYHHREPFWYYLPVTLLAVAPWTVFVIAALAKVIGELRKGTGNAFDQFLLIWLIVPVVFFSISQSKLPGYILPAVPAGAMLLSSYVRRAQQGQPDELRPRIWVAILHAILSSGLIIPALTLQYIVGRQYLVWGERAAISIGFAGVIAIAIVFTLRSTSGLRLLRPVTMIVVVVVIAAVLRLGSPALNRSLSARPVAEELSRVATKKFPIAVFRVPRETEYGLAFYRNQIVSRYDAGQIPAQEHLVIAAEKSASALARNLPGRQVSYLGTYAPQKLDFFYISALPVRR